MCEPYCFERWRLARRRHSVVTTQKRTAAMTAFRTSRNGKYLSNSLGLKRLIASPSMAMLAKEMAIRVL